MLLFFNSKIFALAKYWGAIAPPPHGHRHNHGGIGLIKTPTFPVYGHPFTKTLRPYMKSQT